MKKKILTSLFLLLVLSTFLVACGKDDGKMSNQEKAEKFAEEMKPKMEERIHAEDYNNFVETIKFEKNIEISPMGGIFVHATINDKYDVSFTLNYNDKNDVSTFSFDDEVAKKMGNFDKDKVAPLPNEKVTPQNTSSNLKTILSKYKLNL
ncbi:hypothetical protein [Listeria welshimeri]|uniref:hypothetical protein n=1 Tax=Listeria welshimeri TaxID=1643 RepID=UPI0016281BE7|nr:hypothetical protein [Listeria welshimeri]MBC1410065.1 hypothetical protein [Listeria welshimeri]MBC2349073.1 hypothetical protein [Listeria welshimeri]MBF2368991.1 hypothetical protein [Listeria welshimeri]